MLAQAVTGTPGHVNAMADAVTHFIREIGRENIREGDIYITNDPWKGTGHLHDITVVTPSFHKGQLVGFFACTAHVVDIGGRGFGADANSVYEEGLYIPIMKFADQGKVDQPFVSRSSAPTFASPTRWSATCLALATCNDVGHRRLLGMLEEFDLADVEAVGRFHPRALAQGHARAYRRAEAGQCGGRADERRLSTTPIELEVKVMIAADEVNGRLRRVVGGRPQGHQLPAGLHQGLCLLRTEMRDRARDSQQRRLARPVQDHRAGEYDHQRAASRARRAAPCDRPPRPRHWSTTALDQLLPDLIPAEGAGPLCNFQVSLRPVAEAARKSGARRAEVLMFNCGGSGARPGLDGMNTTAFPSGVMTMPIEATEHAGPVIIWRKELRPDSGGAGRYRGGLGQYMEVGAVDGHVFDISAMFDRVRHAPRGRLGGSNGASTEIHLDDGNGTAMAGKGRQPVPEGRRVKLALPGGGGYGPASKRDRTQVLRDLALGYISADTANSAYGLTKEDIAAVDADLRRGELPVA